MSNQAEDEIAAIKAILSTLEQFAPSARKRIMGYIQHYLRTTGKPPVSPVN